ncbi:hypothetical protein A6395_13090 [Exiguobacterium sp. SH31]|uniref:hypothetical protein n=1 Tax=Exiguobacterium sp. SH31 TaxID=1843183 RepID=UPI0008D1A7B5|nr:hypothetical protein [Exiguobacterium sp. SH31]OGX78271.1 hypothetical protein A6395_13090 [Exiguobacterium sp. SH31]
MKWKVISVILFVVFIGAAGWGYTYYQTKQVDESLQTADTEQLATILERPLVNVQAEWMEKAVEQYDVPSVLVLYEHGGVLTDKQWIYLADLMTFEEFERMVKAGAPLDVSIPSSTLLEGLYSLNDEPEKWRLAHERIDVAFLNTHPNILIQAVYDGNTEAFTDLIERMDTEIVPYEEVAPVVMEMNQQLMLEAMVKKGYQPK